MFAPANRLAKSLTLSEAILSPDRQDRHLEKLLNGLLNLGLVGRKCDLENELIVLIFEGRPLFSNNGPSDYLGTLPASAQPLIYSWDRSLEEDETVETKQVIDVEPLYGEHKDLVEIP